MRFSISNFDARVWTSESFIKYDWTKQIVATRRLARRSGNEPNAVTIDGTKTTGQLTTTGTDWVYDKTRYASSFSSSCRALSIYRCHVMEVIFKRTGFGIFKLSHHILKFWVFVTCILPLLHATTTTAGITKLIWLRFEIEIGRFYWINTT